MRGVPWSKPAPTRAVVALLQLLHVLACASGGARVEIWPAAGRDLRVVVFHGVESTTRVWTASPQPKGEKSAVAGFEWSDVVEPFPGGLSKIRGESPAVPPLVLSCRVPICAPDFLHMRSRTCCARTSASKLVKMLAIFRY
jgi:hypothetical protein